MFLVTIVCSDPQCAEEREVTVDELDAVERHMCDCGYGFVVLRVSELVDSPIEASVVSLPGRRHAPSRHAA
jgi:hypothetical protein